MQKREKILLAFLIAAPLLWWGLPAIYARFVEPLQRREEELKLMSLRLEQKEAQQLGQLRTVAKMREWKEASLPPNEVDALRLYQQWIHDLALLVGLRDVVVSPGRLIPQGTTYTRVQVALESRGSLREIVRFLHEFRRTRLMQSVVQLTISQPPGSDRLALKLTVEGLSIGDAPVFDRLFPHAELTEAVSESTDVLPIKGHERFPAKAPFRVRIGNEFLQVTELTDAGWRVERGVDGTQALAHLAGQQVELAPVKAGEEGNEADWEQLAQADLFGRPTPPGPPPTRSAPPPAADPAASMVLVASIMKDDQPEAWLYDEKNNRRLIVTTNSTLDVGSVTGRVVEIGSDFLIFETAEARRRLRLGSVLTTAESIGEPAAAAAGA